MADETGTPEIEDQDGMSAAERDDLHNEPEDTNGEEPTTATEVETPEDAKPTEGGSNEEPAVDESKSAVDNGWQMTGNSNGDAAIEILNKYMTPDESTQFFAQALQTGDLSTIDLAALEQKMGKADAAATMALVKTFHAEAMAEINATKTAVYEAVGGERVYDALTDWCKAKRAENNPELMKKFDELNVMLNNGGTQAVLAAKEIRALHDADQATSGLSNNLLSGDSPSGQVERGITRAEYMEKRRAAHLAGNQAEFEDAWRLRQIGMKNGL